MFSFKYGRTVFSVDIGFLAVISVISLNGGRFSFQSFIACMIHESGHLAAVLFTGGDIKKVSFSATGIRVVRSEEIMSSVSEDIIILLSGPAASLIASAILLYGKFSYFSSVNLILGLFNLLPFSALDGGSVIDIICDYYLYKSWKLRIMRIIMTAACTVVITVMMTGIRNISVYIMCVFLIFSELKKLHEVID